MSTKQQNQAHESTGNQVRVETVGTGQDKREVVHVPANENEPSLDLVRLTGRGDTEVRVEDEELGRYVEFARPSKIREVINRLRSEDKNFNPLAVFPESGRTGGRRPTRYYLTEIEAVFVIMACGTPKAHQLRWSFANKIVQARKGLLGPVLDPSLVTAMRKALEGQRDEVRALQAEFRASLMDLARQNSNLQAQIVALQHSHESGVIGARLAKTEINAPLSDYARIMARVDLSQGFRAHCSRAHTELRDELEYPAGQGADWRYLSREKFGKAQRVVRKMLSRAIKALNAIQAAENKKASGRQTEFRYDN